MAAAEFSPARARLARAFNGFSRAQLGELVDATPQYIGYLETGARTPTPVMVEALAEVTGFTPDFFCARTFSEFRDDECHFRKRSSTGVALRAQALAQGTLLGQLIEHLEGMLDLPNNGVPDIPITDAADIERAAERCRVEFGVGIDRPIDNVVRTLERAGVVVSCFEGTSERVDAFSRSGGRNVVVLNTLKGCGTRTRFDASHELGHLVMHGGIEPGAQDREREADRFASAFLLPRTGFSREFPRTERIDWRSMFALKVRWKTSVQAIVRRGYDLGLLSAVQYQSACKYVGFRGWRKSEPYDCAPEAPELVSRSLSVLATNGVTFAQTANALRWQTQTLALVSGYTPPEPTAPDNVWGEVIELSSARVRRQREPAS
jgi:Zn-dependent peptidase ImmA (M78 family)/transcriptional regulator with XRE-family HTH domain